MHRGSHPVWREGGKPPSTSRATAGTMISYAYAAGYSQTQGGVQAPRESGTISIAVSSVTEDRMA